MNIPKSFKLEEEEEIKQFIGQYSFATLISQHEGEPYATHLPLIFYQSKNAMYGHFARVNE